MSFEEKMKVLKTPRKVLHSAAREGLGRMETILVQMLFLLAKTFLCYTLHCAIPL